MAPELLYNSNQYSQREINDFAPIQRLLPCISSNKQIWNYHKENDLAEGC